MDRLRISQWIVRLAASAVFLSILPQTTPWLIEGARLTRTLRNKDWDERRTIMFGTYYPCVLHLRERIPHDQWVALLIADASRGDLATFTNYYLYPRKSVWYWGWNNYRSNLVEGAAIGRPKPATVIVIDGKRCPFVAQDGGE
ncbi:MAG TPA: hypothetical protein VM534_04520 [Thermoanaerobaculia bacterium]|nr:hypothetical protein [Thermoanaerobaculia bacterium]